MYANSNSQDQPERIVVTADRPATPTPGHDGVPHGGHDSNGNGPSLSSKPTNPQYTLLDAVGYFDKDKDVFEKLVEAATLGVEVEKDIVEQMEHMSSVLSKISAGFKFIDLGTSFAQGNYQAAFQKSSTLLISSVLTQIALRAGPAPVRIAAALASLGFAVFDITTKDGSALADKVFNSATSGNGGLRLAIPQWDTYVGVPPY
ncbi:hypothetical protein [Spirosoma flavum]|uniref:Uncharacterized protein n=1 Tax=Spirosoma flavum TaxID=2048557 RepID=A0ABW6AUM1_9BACT